MLERLRIKNFQTHRDFTIEFHKSITTLVGGSDTGKSAILRAMRWLALNRPSGDDFINWEAKTASVELQLDGHTIVRKKGVENTYQLDEKEYRAFGTEVPEEIATLLGLSPLNFADQISDPACPQSNHLFWFAQTPGEVAKELNSIVNLSQIDGSLANLASELRKAKAAVELTEERLNQAREQRTTLEWVVGADKALNSIETKETALERVKAQQKQLREVLQCAVSYQYIVEIATNALPALKRAVQLGEAIITVQDQRGVLQGLLDTIEEAQWDLRTYKAAHLQAQAELAKVKTCPACGKAMSKLAS